MKQLYGYTRIFHFYQKSWYFFLHILIFFQKLNKVRCVKNSVSFDDRQKTCIVLKTRWPWYWPYDLYSWVQAAFDPASSVFPRQTPALHSWRGRPCPGPAATRSGRDGYRRAAASSSRWSASGSTWSLWLCSVYHPSYFSVCVWEVFKNCMFELSFMMLMIHLVFYFNLSMSNID